MSFWSYLIVPFAWIMQTFYGIFDNYALALIFYAVVVKVVLFPLSVKQHKNSLNMVRLKPYQDMLQKKYGNNREKYNMELQKLYQREGYNPMSSCGPMLIQLPLIFIIYTVVRHPLSFIGLGTGAERTFSVFAEKMTTKIFDFAKPLMDKLPEGITVENVGDFELQIHNAANSAGIDTGIRGDSLFGIIDLSATPSDAGIWSWMILIPILSCVTSFLVSWVSQKYSPMQMANPNGQGAGSNKMMLYLMPLMSLFFTYSFNCALGLYWIIGNVLSIGQTFLLNKMYDPNKILLEVEAKIEKEKTIKKEKRSAAAAKKAAALAASKKNK